MTFPAKLSHLKDHLEIFFSSLGIRSSNADNLQDLSIRGAPRYFEGRDLTWKFRVLRMFLWVMVGVLKKKTLDLFSLMVEPEARDKFWRICFKALASKVVDFPKSIMSSMNLWWVWVSSIWCKRSPWSYPSMVASLRLLPRPLTPRMKRKGERGSPCLMPWEGLKGVVGDPFTRIEEKEDEIRFIIKLIHIWLNPNASKTFSMYLQFNLSNAFKRSSFRSIPGNFVLSREWITSWARIITSRICLPST